MGRKVEDSQHNSRTPETVLHGPCSSQEGQKSLLVVTTRDSPRQHALDFKRRSRSACAIGDTQVGLRWFMETVAMIFCWVTWARLLP